MTALSTTPSNPAPASGHPRIDGILQSNTYFIFILIFTIFSLVIMAVQVLLPRDTPTWELVNSYDNLICIIFLIDFAMHMIATPRRRDYFIGERGYLDLLGSVPSFGFFQFTVLLRLFRISRLFRLRKVLNPANRKLLRNEILNNRGRYALFLTVLMAILVITLASIFMLFFESRSPDANITDGGDAVWWGFVTITTVGYGDKFPVTAGGRVTAVFVMFAGVGIIGALASILASILVPQPKDDEAEPAPGAPPVLTVEQELAAVKNELSALRALLEQNNPTRQM